MAETFFNKQGIPGAGVEIDLMTASGPTVISSLTVCNQGAATTFRVRLAPLGAANTTANPLYYDTPIGANDTLLINPGWTLIATDKIRVQSASGNVSFCACGSTVS